MGFRPLWITDFCFFVGHYLLWGTAILWMVTRLGDGLGQIIPAAFRQTAAFQPWWIGATEVIVLGDLCA